MRLVQGCRSIPRVDDTVRTRRLMFAGHIFRSNLVTKDILFWSPAAYNPNVSRAVGRPKLSYVDTLLDDVGVESVNELKALMIDKNAWSIICHK